MQQLDKKKNNILPVKKLPRLTRENLDTIMAERIAATRNDETVIPMFWQGMLELEIPVAGMSVRTAKIYVPHNCRQTANFVLMNVPEGGDTLVFLVKSGWIRRADAHKICLFVLDKTVGQSHRLCQDFEVFIKYFCHFRS